MSGDNLVKLDRGAMVGIIMLTMMGCGNMHVRSEHPVPMQATPPLKNSDRKTTMAIMDFSTNGVQAPIGNILAGLIRDQLLESGVYTVLEQQAMEAVLREQAFQKSGCTTAECAVEIGKLLNAEMIVVGEVTFFGGYYRLSARAVDVESRVIKYAGSEEVSTEAELRTAARQVAEALRGVPLIRKNSISGKNILPLNQTPVPLSYQVNGKDEVRSIKEGKLQLVNGKQPSGRSRYGIVDTHKGKILMFGGDSAVPGRGPDISDTWELDVKTSTWRELVLSDRPSPRCWYTTEYDEPRNRIILFGGYAGVDEIFFDEIWIFDLQIMNWKSLDVKVRPPGRAFHTMTLDKKRERLVIVGGRGEGGPLNDAWTFDLKSDSWKEIKSIIRPVSRDQHAAALEESGDALWVIGGETNGHRALNDVWRLDLKSDQWSSQGVPQEFKSRAGHTVSWDSLKNRLLIVGRSDNWAITVKGEFLENWTRYLGGPSGRVYHSSSWEAKGNRLWVTGGDGAGHTLGDIWCLESQTDRWIRWGDEKVFPSRCLHKGKVVGEQLWILPGQSTSYGQSVGDTWRLDLSE